MADFPYSANPANIKRFFEKLQSVGKPSKITFKWIEGIGFKSSNDRSLIAILKALQFTDTSGVPTERWAQFRHKEQSKVVMASAIKESYAALYETYPDAHRKDDEALRNFFSSHTDVGEGAIAYMVRTFKALVEFADFDAAPSDVEVVTDSLAKSRAPLTQLRADRSMKSPLTVNVNIQLQLPATDDAGIYDKLFEALKKHILS